jgi:cystathionine beta-lyase/cystathionine gamma-synthase
MDKVQEKENDSIVLTNTDEGFMYNRSMHEPLIKLREKFNKLYIGSTAFTSSGMSAISSTLQVILNSYDSNEINLIHGNELYCDSPRLFKFWEKLYGFKRYEIDILDSYSDTPNGTFTDNLIYALFKSFDKSHSINILFVESCSNPSGYVFNFDIIAKLRKLSRKLYVIVDNTWLTSCVFNPFDKGADIVVTSLTKYYSAGSCIMGAIITRHETKFYNKLDDFLRINGSHVSPLHCSLVLKNIDSLKERIEKSSALTVKIAKFLLSVEHPSLDTHPSKFLAEKMFSNYPSVLTFVIPIVKDDAIKFMQSIKEIDYKTSFGSPMSRFDPWPKTVAGGTQCRLAIGFNDTYQRLVPILEKALTNIIDSTKLIV